MSIGNRPAQYFPPRDEVIVINNDPDPLKAEVILRTYSPISDSYKDEYVDMSLAPGNPELAAQIQKRNKQISDTKSALLLAPIGPKGLGFVGSKLSGLRQKLPSLFTKPGQIPLQITPGSRGLPRSQQQSAGVMLDPSKPQLTGLSKFLLGIPAFGLPYAALSSLQTEPLTGEDLEEAVEQAKITQKQSDEIQEQLNVISEETTTQPSDITEIVEDPDPEPKPKPEPTPEEDAPPVKELEDVGQERFIDPDNLIAFVRNVGAGLSTTGQLGTGLTLGSKMAAEERAKRDILTEQEKKDAQKEKDILQAKFEYDKKLLELKGTAPSLDVKDVTAQSTNLRDEIDAFNSAERARGLVEASIMILKDARNKGESLTGIGGSIDSFIDKIQAFFNKEEGFEDLSSRTKIDKLSEIVRTGNAREILDDPRLSNYEREIIGDVFGQLKTLESPTIALAKFENALDGLVDANKSRQDLITTLHEGLLTGGQFGQSSYLRTAEDVFAIKNTDLNISTAIETLNRLISGQKFGTNVIGLADE